MTQPAVLADRCVLPKIWTAFLGMALLTSVVDICPRELCRDGITVHVMTAHAVHLALENRVRKCFACLAALHLMAVEANLGLRRRLPDRVNCFVAAVTVGTGHLVAGVRAGVPAKTDVALVTVQACGILFFNRRAGIRAEDHRNWWPLLTSSHAASVRVSRTMAGFALQLAMAKGPARVRRYSVFRAEQGKHFLIIVAGQAGVCALAAVLYVLGIC